MADKSQADYFIHDLPGAPTPLLKMHAGYVEACQVIETATLTTSTATSKSTRNTTATSSSGITRTAILQISNGPCCG